VSGNKNGSYSTNAIFKLSKILKVPVYAGISPMILFNKVDLPHPTWP